VEVASTHSNRPIFKADEQTPRCCPAHRDWPTLTEHLVQSFPEIAINDIVHEVCAARDTTASAGLDDSEAMYVGELVARHRLVLLAPHRADAAGQDPQSGQR
jgi:hypothetical protein